MENFCLETIENLGVISTMMDFVLVQCQSPYHLPIQVPGKMAPFNLKVLFYEKSPKYAFLSKTKKKEKK